MHFFYEIVYPLCLIIMFLVILIPFIGAIYMTMSILSLIIAVWDILKGLVTLQIRSTIMSIKEDLREVIGGIFGLIPGLALIIVVIFLPWYMDYKYAYGQSIDGTYAKVIKVIREYRTEGRDSYMIYTTVIDLGYGQKREATLKREYFLGIDRPEAGQVILVASQDGINYFDHFEDLIIRPTLASWL